MTPLETYARDLRTIHFSGAGVKETSYYPALSALLNEVGRDLRPRVQCIIHPRSAGAGLPDGALFTADQLAREGAADPLPGLLPARGVVGIKGAAANAAAIAAGDQVARYWDLYRLVLVTNLWEFLLVGQDAQGHRVVLERYRLAEDEQRFWDAAASPARLDAERGDGFTEYLRRVLLHNAPLAAPRDVAWFLASYALRRPRPRGAQRQPGPGDGAPRPGGRPGRAL